MRCLPNLTQSCHCFRSVGLDVVVVVGVVVEAAASVLDIRLEVALHIAALVVVAIAVVVVVVALADVGCEVAAVDEQESRDLRLLLHWKQDHLTLK
jgi:hypothetical protein